MLAVPAAPASAQVPSGTSWTTDLAPDADDTGVSATDGELRLDPATAVREVSTGSPRLQGMLLTVQHELADPADRVAADLVADLPPGTEVLVDVRGQRDGGGWTEWVPATPRVPADLETPGRTVQARLMLLAGDVGSSPVVRSLRLTADLAPGLQVDPAPRVADTFRVFATREGLAGGTTANGHVIRPRDHFVALPSRRGLAPLGTGDYTVKVCADNGRCEWAPVWDVGPWNTTDDHWSPRTAVSPGGTSPRACPRRRPPSSTATTVDATSSGARWATRPVSTSATAPSSTAWGCWTTAG